MSTIDSFFSRCIPTGVSVQNSPAASPRAHRKVSNVITSKITIDQVLKNTLDPPVSFDDFKNFLKSEGGQDKLEFLQQCQDYLINARAYYPDIVPEVEMAIGLGRKATKSSPRRDVLVENNEDGDNQGPKYTAPICPSSMEQAKFESEMQKIQIAAANMVRLFVQKNSPSDVSIPDHIRTELCEDMEHGHFHPYIFNNAKAYVKKLLQQTVFPRFVRNATRLSFTAVNLEAPKYTINQLILDELPSPYSFADYCTFLKQTQSEENAEFLQAIIKYQQLAISLHPTPSTKATSRMRSVSSAPPPIYIEESNKFAEEGPALNNPLPSVIPSPVKPTEMSDTDYANALKRCKEGIIALIDTFVKAESPKEVNLPILLRKPLLQAVQDGHTHPDILNAAYEHIAHMLKLNGLSKFLKNAFQTARFNAILETSVPKYSMQQLITNELPRPYTRKDFRDYLVKIHCEENLDFLVAVMNYEREARLFYSYTIPVSEATPGGRNSVTGGTGRNSIIQVATTFEYTPPEKPENMPQDEYDRKLASVHDSAMKIFDEFINMQSKREINIPVVVRKPLLNSIEQKIFHPAIFFGAKKHISDVLQLNCLNKFLRTTYEDKINGGLSLKLATGLKTKMDQLMLDELPYPFSFQAFFDYCKYHECSEGVELVRSIMQYQKLAIGLFAQEPGKKRQSAVPVRYSLSTDKDASRLLNTDTEPITAPSKPKDMSMEDYQGVLKQAEQLYSTIFQNFIVQGAPSVVPLPPRMVEVLLAEQKANNLHPDIFTHVYDYLATNIENNVWEMFQKSFENSPIKTPDSDYPKYTIKQIVQKETPVPYSFDDYMAFLKKEMCDECLEFLAGIYKYQIASASLYPEPVVKPSNGSREIAEFIIPQSTQPSHLTPPEYQVKLKESLDMLKSLVDMFIRPDSPREVNLPVYTRKPFLKLYDQGKIHPDLVTDSFEHIANMLRLNNLTKFLKNRYQVDPKRKDSSPNSSIFQSKATIKEVVLNQLPSPRSLADFRKFLLKEHTEESLDFLLAVIDYIQLSTPFFPALTMDQKLRKTSITPSEADKPEKPAFSATATDQEIAQLTNKMKLATQSILETFISEQAKKEVNITARQRKAILAELESGNLHPEVWRPAFEHIANLLRSNSLTKFLRATE